MTIIVRLLSKPLIKGPTQEPCSAKLKAQASEGPLLIFLRAVWALHQMAPSTIAAIICGSPGCVFWWFPKIRGTFLGVSIVRIIVYWRYIYERPSFREATISPRVPGMFSAPTRNTALASSTNAARMSTLITSCQLKCPVKL